jgi:regulator of cell morphogenesis and NO signaling
MPLADLIDHIVATHHSYLNRALPELSDLTTTILRVHGQKHPDLFRVHKLFHNLKLELEQHLIKEETLLFPMIKEYETGRSEAHLKKISLVVREIEEEHEAAGDILKELRSVTEDYILPGDGCATYGKTLKGLQELESDLFQHIHLENNILFTRLGVEIE